MRSKVSALPALLRVPVRGSAHPVGILDLGACSRLHDKHGAANIPVDTVTLLTSPGWSHRGCGKETSGVLRYCKQPQLKNIKSVL